LTAVPATWNSNGGMFFSLLYISDFFLLYRVLVVL
jgi:hypothetical protein